MRISDWSSDVCSSDLRVLDGQDVALAIVELFQGGIERGRLARASRAGNQDDAVGFCERIAQYAVALAGQAEDVEIDPRAVFVEDAHHDAFAGAARPGDRKSVV